MATFMARKDALFQSIGRFSPGLADTGQFLQVSEFLLHTGKIYLQGLSFETFNLVPAVFFVSSMIHGFYWEATPFLEIPQQTLNE